MEEHSTDTLNSLDWLEATIVVRINQKRQEWQECAMKHGRGYRCRVQHGHGHGTRQNPKKKIR